MINERAERALKIAGLLIKAGVAVPPVIPTTDINGNPFFTSEETDEHRTWYYSTFDGLMPIVERINKAEYDYCAYAIEISDIEVRLLNYTDYNSKDEKFGYSECSLIDALQKAIIFYYEQTEGKNGPQQ